MMMSKMLNFLPYLVLFKICVSLPLMDRVSNGRRIEEMPQVIKNCSRNELTATIIKGQRFDLKEPYIRLFDDVPRCRGIRQRSDDQSWTLTWAKNTMQEGACGHKVEGGFRAELIIPTIIDDLPDFTTNVFCQFPEDQDDNRLIIEEVSSQPGDNNNPNTIDKEDGESIEEESSTAAPGDGTTAQEMQTTQAPQTRNETDYNVTDMEGMKVHMPNDGRETYEFKGLIVARHPIQSNDTDSTKDSEEDDKAEEQSHTQELTVQMHVKMPEDTNKTQVFRGLIVARRPKMENVPTTTTTTTTATPPETESRDNGAAQQELRVTMKVKMPDEGVETENFRGLIVAKRRQEPAGQSTTTAMP